MPLEPGKSHEAISANIATEIRAGKDPKQAAAIAYHNARADDVSLPIIRAAGIMFITPSGNALFLKRSPVGDHAGEWCIPGGKIEDGETAEAAAAREAAEEIGFLPDGTRKLHTRRISGSVHTATPGATAGAVPLPLPCDGGAAPTQPENPVDFTTFIQRVDEQFEPKLNDEHVGFAWAPVGSPPEPLHPGCRIALARLTMDELGVARAIAAGELTSPQHYINHWMFAIRITGTGVSYRSKDKEFVIRDPSLYLNDEFLARCNGLTVIFEHPEKATLNSDEFVNRVVGAIFLPYICGDEVWGIAKIHDETAAKIMADNQLSTSPSVVLVTSNSKVTLDDGSVVLIEGPVTLLDHIAIVPNGVWDKGGDPTGVRNETRSDSAMTEDEKKAAADAAAKADAEAKAAADAARADFQPDKMLKGIADGIESLSKRMDAFETKEKEKADAEAKMKADAEEEEKKKSDKAKADAEEEARKAGDPKQIEADKAKKDAEEAEEKAKAKADAEETRKKIADLEDRLKPRADADMVEMADAQAKADSVFQMFGQRAPRPLDGESLMGFRRRMLGSLKAHSAAWKDVDLASIADSAALGTIETQIYADAQRAALTPTGLPEGQLRELRHTDETGRTSKTFVGQPRSWMRSFSANRRRVGSIRNQS